jgi:hypothetical protein
MTCAKFVKSQKCVPKHPWNNAKKSCEEEVHVKFDIQKLENVTQNPNLQNNLHSKFKIYL